MYKRTVGFLAMFLLMIPGYSFTRHGGAVAGGILGGLALGGLVGSAVADRGDRYYYDDSYYSDGYDYNAPRYYRDRGSYYSDRDLEREKDENARLRRQLEEQREQESDLKERVEKLEK